MEAKRIEKTCQQLQKRIFLLHFYHKNCNPQTTFGELNLTILELSTMVVCNEKLLYLMKVAQKKRGLVNEAKKIIKYEAFVLFISLPYVRCAVFLEI